MAINVELKERLEAALEKYGISKAKASRDMGYSDSMLSLYTTEKYTGDVPKLEEAIVRWLARQEQARSRKKVPIAETAAMKVYTNAIRMAHAEKDIALIVADAGSSKTTAARRYADENPKTVVLIQVAGSGMNRKALIQEMATQLGVDFHRVPQHTLIRNVADTLASRDSLVIIDEADYLKVDALEFVRRIVYDLGESGLVLIGLPRLRGMIQNLRNDHRQLESRIGICLHTTGLDKADAKLIASGIWPQVKKEVVEAAFAVSGPDVRQFVKILERAQNTMAINELTEPSVEIIEMASSMVLRRRA